MKERKKIGSRGGVKAKRNEKLKNELKKKKAQKENNKEFTRSMGASSK